MSDNFSSRAIATLMVCAFVIAPTRGVAGTVVGWGGNNFGQLSPCATNAVAISAGWGHSILLQDDGTLVDCGEFYNPGFLSAPILLPPGLTNIIAVSAGDSHSLALRQDGTVVVWGLNYNGQTNVPAGLSNVVAISAGARHSLALKTDGTVAAWGFNGTNIPPGLSNVVAISAGTGCNLALKSDTTVVGWDFQTDHSATLDSLSNIVAVSAGDDFYYERCLVLNANGQVYRQELSGTMTLVTNNAIAIACSRGNDHHLSLILRANRTVVAWGFNFYGGPNVPTGLNNVTAIAAGSGHNLVITGVPIRVPMMNPQRNQNSFSVSIPSRSGRVYRLEYKTTISGATWDALPLVAGTGSVITLTDATASNEQRFYQIREW